MSRDDVISGALTQLLHDCPHVEGAVLATDEGLVLAACGALSCDAAAAGAVHIVAEVDRCLSLLAAQRSGSLLIWEEHSMWYLKRLYGRWVIMANACSQCRVGALRMAVNRVGLGLEPALEALAAPDAEYDEASG